MSDNVRISGTLSGVPGLGWIALWIFLLMLYVSSIPGKLERIAVALEKIEAIR